MQKTLISFIIPIYNREKFLNKCIDSIVNQTYKEIEVILIDDGSIDKSAQICKTYEQRDSRIKYYYQNNAGVSTARNNGINQANGEYICFVDSDDYIELNLAEKLVQIIRTDNPDLIIYGFINENQDGNFQFYEKSNLNISNFNVFLQNYGNLLEKNLLRSPVNKLYSTRILKDNNIKFKTNAKIAEDAIFNIDYLKYTNKINIIENTFYHIVNNTDVERLSTTFNENNLELQNIFFSRVLAYLKSKSSLTEENLIIISTQYNYILYQHILEILKQEDYINKLDNQHKFLLRELILSPCTRFIEQYINTLYLDKKYKKMIHLCKNKFRQRSLVCFNDRKYIKSSIWFLLSLINKK